MEPWTNTKAKVSFVDVDAGYTAICGFNCFVFYVFAETTDVPDLGAAMQHQMHFYGVPRDVTRLFYGTISDVAALGDGKSDLSPVTSTTPLGAATQLNFGAVMLGIAVTGPKSKDLFASWSRVVRGINTCCYMHTQAHGDVNLRFGLQASEGLDNKSKTQTVSGLGKVNLVRKLELQLRDQKKKHTQHCHKSQLG